MARDPDRVEAEVRARPLANMEDDDPPVVLQMRLHERVGPVAVADEHGEAEFSDLVERRLGLSR